jgi:hypothetical protein
MKAKGQESGPATQMCDDPATSFTQPPSPDAESPPLLPNLKVYLSTGLGRRVVKYTNSKMCR